MTTTVHNDRSETKYQCWKQTENLISIFTGGPEEPGTVFETYPEKMFRDRIDEFDPKTSFPLEAEGSKAGVGAFPDLTTAELYAFFYPETDEGERATVIE